MWVHRVALISVSIAFSQTPAYAARPQIWGKYIAWCACLCPGFAGTKFYCLVTEAHRCEQLAQGFYSAARFEPATSH